jgi:hypothetical protein
MFRIALISAALMLDALFAQSALAYGCESVLAAQVKGLDTPSRSTTRIETSSGTTTSVSVAIGGKIWSQTKDGTWQAQPQPLDRDMIAAYWSDKRCTADGTESVDGDPADVVLHKSGGANQMDTSFWISQSSGLIVKTVVNTSGAVFTISADYHDVHAPAADAGRKP